ncbi:MAG TPA: MFS transporter [Porphyromonadaceae bacterium]|jgi:DHA3 family macrolide efflux protein-like MFS transporter|uniref:MFS transporter n=1 Tax=Limibacterium fermenti TaxID=3229863 RepID=UPI000E89C130|nr:MFS transporter [Porphyromonadaceae bacterium]HBL33989.1 MFS transporter [Porphyromonadaceae bacterium]HBX20843.1 MFS transporter [Porphyromonadaceae bacterium]HBX47036.1 MFS transporter [Porphyromonadaceae bacterium]
MTDTNWIKKITWFLASQTISLFGTSLVQYAIMWHITLKTQSGIMMTIAILCGFLPIFFLSPFAGVWADRYDRKKLIIAADSFIALATLVLVVFFHLGYGSLWMLFAVSAIRAFGSAVQTPAVNSFIPQLVPVDKLTKVNATNTSIQSMVNLLSPMISGALLSLISIEYIFLIDVITAAIGIFILAFFLHTPPHAKAMKKSENSYLADMQAGLTYIRTHLFLKKYFIYLAVFFVLMAPAAFLTPLQVARSFGDDVWRLTVLEVVFSIGMILGGALMAFWGGFKNRVHTMGMASLFMGCFTVALGIVPDFWVYIFFMGLFGCVMPLFNTPGMVLLQETVEPDFMGRVFSVMGMISSIMLPLGMIGFGPLADVVKIEWLLLFTGILIMGVTYFFISDKVLVRAGIPLTPKSPQQE